MVKNKKGAGLSVEMIIIMLLGLVVLIAVGYMFFKSQGTGQSNLNALSLSKNGILIDRCNGFCDKMKGGVSSVSGIIGSADSAKYSYCEELRDFYKEDGGKDRKTCAAAAGVMTPSTG